MDATASLWTLFVASFLAATLLPGGSEAVFYAVVRAHPDTLWMALGTASLGNTLGGMSSYLIGRLIPQKRRPARALELLQRYGSPALFFSWVPFIGDPLCVAAGWLRIHAGLALLWIGAGKFARYAAIAALAT
jgi:membrane protein YqaA with SNARE-associated domain